MIDTVSASTNNFPLVETIQLMDCQGRRGVLTDIIEPDGEDLILARIAGELVELPRALSARLWGLMGQRVVVARFGDNYRAERCVA